MDVKDDKLSIQGERLKKLRAEYKPKKLTQKEVADKIGCGIVSYRDWEKGKRSPDTVYLIELAKLFQVSCDYILGITDFTKIGNREISEITGLSDYSINVLREHLNITDIVSVINKMLESRLSGFLLLSSIGNYLGTDNDSTYDLSESKVDFTVKKEISANAIQLFEIQERLIRLKGDVYNNGKNKK